MINLLNFHFILIENVFNFFCVKKKGWKIIIGRFCCTLWRFVVQRQKWASQFVTRKVGGNICCVWCESFFFSFDWLQNIIWNFIKKQKNEDNFIDREEFGLCYGAWIERVKIFLNMKINFIIDYLNFENRSFIQQQHFW